MGKRFQRSVEGEKRSTLKAVDFDLESVDEEDEDIVIEDLTTNKIAEWFEHLQARAGIFGAGYPFQLTEDARGLLLKEPLSAAQRLYLVLLMMSNLHYFQEIEGALTTDFERLCQCALRRLLPSGAEVHIFGKGAAASPRYAGTAWQRIQRLAADLRATLLAKAENFPPQSTGDGGLDLVAWVPWQDAESASLAIFGQCACGPEWKNKQHSSKPEVWCSNKIFISCPPLNAVFTPHFLRKGDGRWQRPHEMGPYLHIDRLRLACLLTTNAGDLASFASFGHVAKVLAAKAEPA